MKIGIIGPGRWGSTLAVLAQKQHEVILFGLEEDCARLNEDRSIPFTEGLPPLPPEIGCTVNPGLLRHCELIFLTVPGHFLEKIWREYKIYAKSPVVVAVKTITCEARKKLVVPTDLIDKKKVAYFASAAFPEGLLGGSPSIGTVYSDYPELGKRIQAVFPKEILRTYLSGDLIGGQIGSALKNVVAIAAGAASGLGLEVMTVTSLVSRGAYEIARFAKCYGAEETTFGAGSSFLADLFGTCLSEHSHNHQIGRKLAKEEKMDFWQTQADCGTAEGIWTTRVLREIGALDDDKMPIAKAVNAMICGTHPKVAMQEILARPLKNKIYPSV